MQYYQVDALSTFYRNLQHDYIEISGIFKVREKETRFVGPLKSGGWWFHRVSEVHPPQHLKLCLTQWQDHGSYSADGPEKLKVVTCLALLVSVLN